MKTQVRCVDTKSYKNRNEAFCGKDRRWYSSKEAYEKILKEREARDACYEALSDLCGYKNECLVFPPVFKRELKAFAPYGYDTVLLTIKDQAENIRWAVENREFPSEYRKASYIRAIIENNINKEIKAKRAKAAEEAAIARAESAPIDDVMAKNSRKCTDISRLLDD